ncbi:MAG TPA: hypothetical protein VHU13_00290 [Solirubrobacteraceae bacterium]|nr:hypothetical protein [Solirubrobacteraceae bacterium]
MLGVALATVALLLLAGKPTSLDRVLAGLIGALAGAVVGSSLTILIDKRLQRGPVSQMLEVLEKTLGSTMTSVESDLAGLRTVWHHYHLTVVKGTPTWRYEIFNFDRDLSIGSLTASVASRDSDGEPHDYRIDAAVRGSRLILTQTALQGQEAPMVEIFPYILHDFRTTHAGVGIVQTWDGIEILSSALLSRRPLFEGSEADVISDEQSRHLTALWEEIFGDFGKFLRTTEAARRWQGGGTP